MTKVTAQIHPSAIIETGAVIGSNTAIGPYCHIGPNVKLGDNCTLHAHVVIAGHTSIGDGSTIFPFASIGHAPQDLKFKGEKSTLTIGKNNVIREHVTINPGTEGGGLKTVIGDSCLLMIGVHVAHDCIVGNHVIMANNATLAGHVKVGDFAVLGGLSAVHQFVRIGHNAMIGGMSAIESDVIPYGSAMGERANLAGLNIVGMKRRGFDRKTIHALRGAYRMLFAPEGTLDERIAEALAHYGDNEAVKEILEFIQQDSSRAICLPRKAA